MSKVAITGVEAANGVAKDYEALWKTGEALVVTSAIGGELKDGYRRYWLFCALP